MISQKPCDRLNNVPQESKSQSLDSIKYTLYGKRSFANVMKYLEMGQVFDYPGEPNNVITSDLI